MDVPCPAPSEADTDPFEPDDHDRRPDLHTKGTHQGYTPRVGGERTVSVGFMWGECMGREGGEEGMGTYVALLVWCGV